MGVMISFQTYTLSPGRFSHGVSDVDVSDVDVSDVEVSDVEVSMVDVLRTSAASKGEIG